MARPIQTDPHMNFRFGVRHNEQSPWLGFTEVYIVPGLNGGEGVLHLRKHLGGDFIDFLNQAGSRLNIGIFHISEECFADPRLQIDLYGLRWAQVEMGPIKLNAAGGDPREQVLQTEIAVAFASMKIRDQQSTFVQGLVARDATNAPHSRYQRVVKTTVPVVM